jgi:uncharacterized protein (PEP-CTERM system associated)
VAGVEEPLAAFNDNNTQTGGGVAWTLRMTPSLSLNTSADVLRTVANPPQAEKTTQGTLRTTLTTPVAANTTVYAGARYQRLRSDLSTVSTSYNEAAVYVGLTHTFH